jgi:RNA polymerase sigma-70 factor (ECF subfamily)
MMDSHTLRQHECKGGAASLAICNERALVQQAVAGDAKALELLFAPNMCRLHRVALAILRNKEDAEDALQNGLCNAYTCLRSFQGRSTFSTWLTPIVMNSALTTLRLRRSHPEFSLDEILEDRPEWVAHTAADNRPNPEQIYALVELNALFEEEIRRLPPSQQTAFRCFALKGLSIRESCQALGTGAGTFKSRVFRTRRKLAHRLQHSLGKACGI